MTDEFSRRTFLGMTAGLAAIPVAGQENAWSLSGYGEFHAYRWGFTAGSAVGSIFITPWEIRFRQLRGERSYVDAEWADVMTFVQGDIFAVVFAFPNDRMVDLICYPAARSERRWLAENQAFRSGRRFISSALEDDDLLLFVDLP